MRTEFRLLSKITAVALTFVMLTATLVTTAFASYRVDAVPREDALSGALSLDRDERVEVIVKFDSPSSLELDLPLGSALVAQYERKLLEEQDEVLGRLGIVPEYRYTSILNAVAIEASEAEIRRLERTSGVEGVYLTKAYDVPVTDGYQEQAISVTEMLGASDAFDSGYTGDGVLVAILDSGLNLDHEAFNNVRYVENPRLTEEKLAELGFASKAGYHNEKIPFYFDYTTNSALGFYDVSGHGSHVAGIIGGYAENPDSTVKFSGIAPGVQICAMKVLGEIGGRDSEVFAALEDAYKLGVDVINLSIGRDSGFRLDSAYYVGLNGIFAELEEAGITVVCSVGNSAAMHLDTMTGTLDENYTDYGTLSSPGIYPGNIGVGSANNAKAYAYAIVVDGAYYYYGDKNAADLLGFRECFEGKSVDIAFFDNYGKAEDYVGVDVSGKIIAVKRGELSFTDKCKYAAEAGAIGMIVINQEGAQMGNLVIENQTIPAVMVEYAITEKLPITDCTLSFGLKATDNSQAGLVSYFSAIGVTPDLEIGLDILGVGSAVYSVDYNTDDGYKVHSGTSMAAPSVSGAYALVYEMMARRADNAGKSKYEITSIIDGVTQSSATLLSDAYGNRYSPRTQGTGLINVVTAMEAEAYISNPIQSLGYDKSASGRLSVEYELVSMSDTDKQYYASVSAITDNFTSAGSGKFRNTLEPFPLSSSYYTYQLYVDGALVEDGGTILLPAGESVSVKLELALNPNILQNFSKIYPSGYFLDGFLELYDVSDTATPALHGSYVSYVGDWLAGPAIEPLTQLELYDWIYSKGADPYDYVSAFTAIYDDANFSFSSLMLGDEAQYHLGQNPLAPSVYFPSNTDRHAISAAVSDADEVLYDLVHVKPSFIRSCREVTYVVTNSATGEVYAHLSDEYVSKDLSIYGIEYFTFSDFVFDTSYISTDELGEVVLEYIPTGTDITISVYTLLDHPDATERLELAFDLTVDYAAPELYYDYSSATKQLAVRCTDSEYVAGIVISEVGEDGGVGKTVDSRIFAEDAPGVVHNDLFELADYAYDSVYITVSDYAGNVIRKNISLKDGNVSNIPVTVTADASTGIDLDLDGLIYLYQDIEFSVTASEGYCFTDDFALLVNGAELAPVSFEDGVYYYAIALTIEELTITAEGVIEHSYVGTVTTPESCSYAGVLTYVCSNCSHVGATEQISPHGHKGGAPVTVIEASCDGAGLATVSCTECNALLDTVAISAHGHTRGEAVVTVEATCTEAGLKVVRCVDCESVLETEIIAAHGHKVQGISKDVKASVICSVCGEFCGPDCPDGVLWTSLAVAGISVLALLLSTAVILIRRRL